MEDEKITLDRKTFKVLASETRINILKSLDKRRKTLSELSRQFNMSVSTIKEHLDNLVEAGLIEQKDDGHKWKYYELTKKGKSVLHPGEKKIWIILSLSIVGFVYFIYDMVSNSIIGAYKAKALVGSTSMTLKSYESYTRNVNVIPQFYIDFGLALFFLTIVIISTYLIYKNRKFMKEA